MYTLIAYLYRVRGKHLRENFRDYISLFDRVRICSSRVREGGESNCDYLAFKEGRGGRGKATFDRPGIRPSIGALLILFSPARHSIFSFGLSLLSEIRARVARYSEGRTEAARAPPNEIEKY